jgi:hypothetical protein
MKESIKLPQGTLDLLILRTLALTRTGRLQLGTERDSWQKLTAAVARVLDPA